MQNNTNIKDIPNFALGPYGDEQAWQAPESFFYEEIWERGNVYDWEIKPHRHASLYQYFLLKTGTVLATIDGTQIELTAPIFFSVPPMTVHGFHFEENTNGHVLSVLASAMGSILPLAQGLLPTLNKAVTISGDNLKPALPTLIDCFDNIRLEFKSNATGRQQYLHAQIALLLVNFARLQDHNATGRVSTQTEDERLAMRFKEIVEESFRSHSGNEYYAKELGVSMSRLASATSAVLGTSPQSVIHERITLEAKRNLIYTLSPAAEIAYSLGFKDPAYFSRFFKKQTGTTPAQFRKSAD